MAPRQVIQLFMPDSLAADEGWRLLEQPEETGAAGGLAQRGGSSLNAAGAPGAVGVLGVPANDPADALATAPADALATAPADPAFDPSARQKTPPLLHIHDDGGRRAIASVACRSGSGSTSFVELKEAKASNQTLVIALGDPGRARSELPRAGGDEGENDGQVDAPAASNQPGGPRQFFNGIVLARTNSKIFLTPTAPRFAQLFASRRRCSLEFLSSLASSGQMQKMLLEGPFLLHSNAAGDRVWSTIALDTLVRFARELCLEVRKKAMDPLKCPFELCVKVATQLRETATTCGAPGDEENTVPEAPGVARPPSPVEVRASPSDVAVAVQLVPFVGEFCGAGMPSLAADLVAQSYELHLGPETSKLYDEYCKAVESATSVLLAGAGAVCLDGGKVLALLLREKVLKVHAGLQRDVRGLREIGDALSDFLPPELWEATASGAALRLHCGMPNALSPASGWREVWKAAFGVSPVIPRPWLETALAGLLGVAIPGTGHSPTLHVIPHVELSWDVETRLRTMFALRSPWRESELRLYLAPLERYAHREGAASKPFSTDDIIAKYLLLTERTGSGESEAKVAASPGGASARGVEKMYCDFNLKARVEGVLASMAQRRPV